MVLDGNRYPVYHKHIENNATTKGTKMFTIYTSNGREIKKITEMSSFAGAIEVAEREAKYGSGEQVWIEGPDGKIYN